MFVHPIDIITEQYWAAGSTVSSNAPHTRQQKKAEKVREATQRWDVAFDRRTVTGQREACQEKSASQEQGKTS